ncbi:MAG TPA: hypothetical protein VMW10_10585 [Alphaproteobacteria bacterium]|nr:hypothetical protein [Alphaproteobacteria bacterium]
MKDNYTNLGFHQLCEICGRIAPKIKIVKVEHVNKICCRKCYKKIDKGGVK